MDQWQRETKHQGKHVKNKKSERLIKKKVEQQKQQKIYKIEAIQSYIRKIRIKIG